MQERIDQVVALITRNFAQKLEALFLYGSALRSHYQPEESDINFLMVTTQDTTMHEVRQLWLPIWQEHGDFLKSTPLTMTKDAFERYMQLNPLLATHLIHEGKQLLGPKTLLAEQPVVDPHDAYASLAAEALTLSSALVPSLLAPEVATARLARLRSLARRLHGTQIPADETAVQLFARVHHSLNPRVSRLPGVKNWLHDDMPATTSPFLPGLQAIYKESDKMVMVFTRLTPEKIVRINWERLSERLQDQCSGLIITTAAQLCLSVIYEDPIAISLHRYQHNWGFNPLADITVAPKMLMRHAARIPARLAAQDFPQAYLTQVEEQFHNIIHDFQNKILNMQLEHELFCRLDLTDRFTPPAPLPGRDASQIERLDGIMQHFAWWAEFYTTKMYEAG